MIVGAFGPIVFSVSSDVVRTFRSGTRKRSTVFYPHAVIGRAPRLEAAAPELDEVDLEIKLDQNLGTSPAIELYALNEIMALQSSWPLFLGPVPVGEYVLTEIKEEWRRFTGAGVLASAIVGLHLLQDAESNWAGKVGSALGL